jgi:hypothetical protein
MRQVIFLLCLSGLLFVPKAAKSQTGTTSIVGDVTDPQGGPVAGAKVSIIDKASAVSRESQTDETGHYQFLSLQPGTYTLHAEAPGFRASVTELIEALVSVTKRVDVKLELGALAETITVTEGVGPTVNTTDATIGNAFDSQQILALPFEGRDAAAVLSLQPGIAFIGNNVDDRFDTRNGAVNGGRSDQANITLDGVDNNDQLRGTAFSGALRSTLDSIEEFRVTTAGANADEGRSSGGQVTLVTKSGTNHFHGAAFEQHRPTNMAANDWFNKHNELTAGLPNIRPKFLRNTFGGAIGGPVKKDRLFFFYTYEGQRISEGSQVNRSVPSASLRDGVVFYPCAATASQTAAQVCPGGGIVTGLSGTAYNVPTSQFGVGPAQIAQMDPNCSSTGSCPQGNGVNPSIIAVFKKYPLPSAGDGSCPFFDGFGNVDCNSFSSPTPIRNNTNIAKLDYNINRSGTHRLFLRGNYQLDRASDVEQFQGGPPINLTRDTSRALAVGYTAVFSSTLINSFRYGFTRESRSNEGLQNTPLVLFRVIDDLVPNTSTRAFQFPVHNWVDDVSWTRGKHTLQFGTNLRLINNIRTSNATSFSTAALNPGFLTVSPAGHGISLDPAAFGFPAVDPNNTSAYNNAITTLVGLVTQGNASYNFTKTGAVLPQGAPVHRHFRAWETEWYVQDVWHVKSNLTVTAGLRYTILEPPYETTGTQAAPNISIHDLVDTRSRMMAQGLVDNPVFSFDLSGQANGKKPYWGYDYKDLGPRVAIAYSPSADGGLWKSLFGGPGKSSIRAGFGIVYDHFGQGVVDTFDRTGTFGLTTAIGNPTNQTVDGGARFTSTTDIPVSSPAGQLLFAAPPGGFPATPPSTLQLFGGLGLDDKLKTPYSELVDLAVTRELPGGLVFEAAYVGRFAHRLLEQRDLAMPLNLRDPVSGMDYFAAAKLFAQAFNSKTDVNNIKTIPFFEKFFPGATGVDASAIGGYCGVGTPPANPTATQSMYEAFSCQIGPGTFGESNALFNIDAFCFPACATINGVTTPNAFYLPQFSTLYGWSTFGKSGYNAGQFTLRSKPSHGVQFDFNYTYSKSLDTGSDAERVPTFGGISGAVVNTWNPNQLFGPSDFDVRHSINSNWLVELPFGRGRHFGANWNRFADTLGGGWQITGLGRWSTGLPFSVSNAFPGGTGPFPTDFQLPGFATLIGARPTTGLTTDSNGDPNVFPQGAAVAGSAFRFDFAGESGQRNILRGQGYFGIDAGVNKTFRITERQSLRFSAYAFNILNTVRFDSNSILNSFPVASTFGKYQGTLTTSRRLEFVLRYQF